MPSPLDVSEVLRGLDKFERNVKDAAKVALRITEAQVVQYAKQNAPWTDRTGNARQSLHAEFQEDKSGYRSAIGIGVDYGVYLELSHGGRYRIIDPAVFSYGKIKLLENLKGIM